MTYISGGLQALESGDELGVSGTGTAVFAHVFEPKRQVVSIHTLTARGLDSTTAARLNRRLERSANKPAIHQPKQERKPVVGSLEWQMARDYGPMGPKTRV